MPAGLAARRHLRAGGCRRAARRHRVTKRVAVAHAASHHHRGAGIRGVPSGLRTRRRSDAGARSLRHGDGRAAMRRGVAAGVRTPSRRSLIAYIGIDDAWAMDAMRRLARPVAVRIHRIAAGASGAAALGGLLAALEDPAASDRQGRACPGRHVQRGGDRQRGRHRSAAVASRGGQLMRRLLVTLGVVGAVRGAHRGNHLAAGRAPAHARSAVRRLAAQHLAHFMDRARAHARPRRSSTPTSSTRSCGRSPIPTRSCCKAWSRRRSSVAARRR